MIIAVDFDGTLSLGARWPELGVANKELFEYLSEKQESGATLILWTCRHDGYLMDAIDWCSSFGLRFDYVNENVPWLIEKYGDCRKVFADVYIDDKNMIFNTGSTKQKPVENKKTESRVVQLI